MIVFICMFVPVLLMVAADWVLTKREFDRRR